MKKIYTTTILITLSNILFPNNNPNTEKPPLLQTLFILNSNRSLYFKEEILYQGLLIDESINFSKKTLSKALIPYVNCDEITEESIKKIKQTILNCYHAHNQNLIAVEVPEQDISSNTLKVVIIEPRLENITYKGNRWFPTYTLKTTLDLESGDTINEDEILNKLAWLNQNPFHHSEVTVSPGSKKGYSNLEIETKDRFPLKIFGAANNNGTESTGTARYSGGFVWGNAFFCDGVLTYQFTSNNHYNQFHAHTINYTAHLFGYNTLSIYGGYAEIQPSITNFQNLGKDAQASFRYKMPFLPLYTCSESQFYFGFDYKYFNSALFFAGELDPTAAIIESNVNVTETMLGYSFSKEMSRYETDFQLELYGSYAKWLPHQNNHSYSALRTDAKPRFFYGRLTWGNVYTFENNCSLSLLLRGQGTPNTLIPSEQFAFGGFDTVRGYENNVFISDNAFCANLEFRTRPYSFYKNCDGLVFLAFVDYGWGYNYHAFDGITKTANLIGIGPGVRYSVKDHLSIRVDYGFRLNDIAFDTSGIGFCHAGLVLSF